MSKETFGIVLGVGSFIVFLALYLIDKSEKTIPVYVSILLLSLLAGLSISALLLIPWFWSSPLLAEKVWRVSLASLSILLLVARFGIWLGLLGSAPKAPVASTEAFPKKSSESAVEIAPAGFIRFVGQVLNGYAPMLQENQTETPLDDVHLSIIQDFPSAEDPHKGTVGWQKEIDVGTVRAKLTKGLAERFPIKGQERIRFNIFMLTRLQSYRETIELTKQDDKQYKAELHFYGSGPKPLYTQTTSLNIVTIPGARASNPLANSSTSKSQAEDKFPQSNSTAEELSPYLLYGNKRLEIHNAGQQNIWLWGFAYGTGPVSTEKESTLIAPSTFYFLPADDLESRLLSALKNGEETLLPCRVFVAIHDSEKKTIRCSLGVSRNGDTLTINTRIIDIVDGWMTGEIN